jgi:hypothetical protein
MRKYWICNKNFSKETKTPSFSDKMIRKFLTKNSFSLRKPRIIEQVGPFKYIFMTSIIN